MKNMKAYSIFVEHDDKNDQDLVIHMLNGKVYQYVVCKNYDPSKPFGQQWDFGHYFWSIEDAIQYLKR